MTIASARRLTRDLQSALSILRRQQPGQELTDCTSIPQAVLTSKRRRYTVDAGPASRSFFQSHTPTAEQESAGSQFLVNDAVKLPPPATDSTIGAGLFYTPSQAGLESVNYKTRLRLAIKRADPYEVIQCLAAARQASDYKFLAAITNEEFAAVLDLVQPQQLLGDAFQTQASLRPSVLGYLGLPQAHRSITRYIPLLPAIADLRRRAGVRLSLQHYRQLLTACKEIRSRQLAQQLWFQLAEDGHKPDTACYNGFMGSVMYERLLSAHDKHADRVTPPALAKRQYQHLTVRYGSFRVGQGGILEIVTSILAEMALQEVAPNVETHCLHIRAAAVEGKVDIVSDILQKVWHIDVGKIATAPDLAPRQLARDDPLYPTQTLLLETVQAFGNNNDFHTALMLAGYMSRHYSVKLTEVIWSELLGFAHMFQQHSRKYEIQKMEANVVRGTVESLWETMIRPPYNIMPSPQLAHKRMAAAYQAHQTLSVLPIMEHYRKHFMRVTKPQKQAAWVVLQAVLASSSTGDDTPQGSQPSLQQASRQYDLALLRFYQESRFLGTWLHYFLQTVGNHERIAAATKETVTVTVPQMLTRWRFLGDGKVKYLIATGVVELDFTSERRLTEDQRYSSDVEKRHAENLGSRMAKFDGSPDAVELDQELYNKWLEQQEAEQQEADQGEDQNIDWASDKSVEDALVDLDEYDAETRY